jgi:glutamate racemase
MASGMATRSPADAGAFLLFCRGMQSEVITQNSPVGLFDSGVGGLSVIRSIWKELPDEDLIFLADQAHVPYGPRPLEEVRQFAKEITRFLLDQGAKLIVVACNAASAAALHYLRQTFPRTTFVGMEPAVKPAAEHSQSKVVAVLATPATFQGRLYASLVERFAADTLLLQHTCPGLVAQIEAGDLDGASTRQILEEALHPMLAQGADTVVLGCTHYPFVIPLIQQIVGPELRVIDPAPAVARRVRFVLETQNLCRHSPIEESPAAEINPIIRTRFLTTGDAYRFQIALSHLLDVQAETNRIEWIDDRLVK